MTNLEELQKTLDQFFKKVDVEIQNNTQWLRDRKVQKSREQRANLKGRIQMLVWVRKEIVTTMDLFGVFQRELEEERRCNEIKMGAMLKALEQKHRELEGERKLLLDLKKHAKTSLEIYQENIRLDWKLDNSYPSYLGKQWIPFSVLEGKVLVDREALTTWLRINCKLPNDQIERLFENLQIKERK